MCAEMVLVNSLLVDGSGVESLNTSAFQESDPENVSQWTLNEVIGDRLHAFGLTMPHRPRQAPSPAR